MINLIITLKFKNCLPDLMKQNNTNKTKRKYYTFSCSIRSQIGSLFNVFFLLSKSSKPKAIDLGSLVYQADYAFETNDKQLSEVY